MDFCLAKRRFPMKSRCTRWVVFRKNEVLWDHFRRLNITIPIPVLIGIMKSHMRWGSRCFINQDSRHFFPDSDCVFFGIRVWTKWCWIIRWISHNITPNVVDLCARWWFQVDFLILFAQKLGEMIPRLDGWTRIIFFNLKWFNPGIQSPDVTHQFPWFFTSWKASVCHWKMVGKLGDDPLIWGNWGLFSGNVESGEPNN